MHVKKYLQNVQLNYYKVNICVMITQLKKKNTASTPSNPLLITKPSLATKGKHCPHFCRNHSLDFHL